MRLARVRRQTGFCYHHPGGPASRSSSWVFGMLQKEESVSSLANITVLQSSSLVLAYLHITLWECNYHTYRHFLRVWGGTRAPFLLPFPPVRPCIPLFCSRPHRRHLMRSHPLPLKVLSRIKTTSFQLVTTLRFHVPQTFTLRHLMTLIPCPVPFSTSLWLDSSPHATDSLHFSLPSAVRLPSPCGALLSYFLA